MPSFDRWRARQIANTAPGYIGSTEEITFTATAASVTLACPFYDDAGAPCAVPIAYYFSTETRATKEYIPTVTGACVTHVANALALLRSHPKDDAMSEALDGVEPTMPATAPIAEADRELAERLVASKIAVHVDFGTTTPDERYPYTKEANVILDASKLSSVDAEQLIILARQCGLNVSKATKHGNHLRLSTSWMRTDSGALLIAKNRALRTLMSDFLAFNKNGGSNFASTGDGSTYVEMAHSPALIVPSEPKILNLIDAIFPTTEGQKRVVLDYYEPPIQRSWRYGTESPLALPIYPPWPLSPGDYIDFGDVLRRIVDIREIGDDDGSEKSTWVTLMFERMLISDGAMLAKLEDSVRCRDCHVDVLELRHSYMVHNDLWNTAGYAHNDMACIFCLEKRLGRKLVPTDFTDAIINQFSENADLVERTRGVQPE